jgi:hypothetical protein
MTSYDRDDWYDSFQKRCDDGLISTFNFSDPMDWRGTVEYVYRLNLPEDEL